MEIQPILNTEKGIYEIKDYEAIKEKAIEFVNNIISIQPKEIYDVNTLKVVKDSRTEIRNRKKALTDLRLQINKTYFGTFNEQLKSIEDLLSETDDKLKANVDAYNEKIGNVKPKAYKLEIVSYDPNAINQIKELAIKLNCAVKEK